MVDPIKIFFRKIYRKSVLEKNPKMMKDFQDKLKISPEEGKEGEVQNPYIDEFDKKKKKARKYDTKMKNFEPRLPEPFKKATHEEMKKS